MRLRFPRPIGRFPSGSGGFLRRTSLDELPQVWNVLRGEMSLVGPRPYLPRESDEMGEAKSDILRVPPRITGPWQVFDRNQATFDQRVELDVYYVHDWYVWLDIVLLARTGGNHGGRRYGNGGVGGARVSIAGRRLRGGRSRAARGLAMVSAGPEGDPWEIPRAVAQNPTDRSPFPAPCSPEGGRGGRPRGGWR